MCNEANLSLFAQSVKLISHVIDGNKIWVRLFSAQTDC